MPQVSPPSDASRSLARHRLPPLTFDPQPALPDVVRPLWRALYQGNTSKARRLGYEATETLSDHCADQQAALLVGLAAAERRAGGHAKAERWARKSLERLSRQRASHRILLQVMVAEQRYEAAYEYLQTQDPPISFPPAWDEALSPKERELALAAWAWQLGRWERAAQHLHAAFPEGVASMPAALREDWFRLALHREAPDDAAQAAATLLQDCTPIEADALLQALVQKGWTAQALPLYLDLMASAPPMPLLRRRLIALHLREGNVREAQRLRDEAPSPVERTGHAARYTFGMHELG